MPTSHRWPRPPLLFGAAVFAAIALLLGREFLPLRDPPALAVAAPGGIRVTLGEGFPSPGIRHFSDELTLQDVMVLTGHGEAPALSALAGNPGTEVVDGMTLAIVANPAGERHLQVGWMPAKQRVALGIPLHPDRMSHDDWVTLPGIGEQLASRIEVDRQKYGDFGHLDALERVKGIGPAKLRALRPYFVPSDNLP
jgi:competence protein ComEA